MTQAKLLPEWAPQDGVLLAWPHRDTDWAPFLPQIEQVFAELIRHITRFEAVVLLCPTPTLAERVRDKLTNDGIDPAKLHILYVPYDDTWLRDSGPLSIAADERIYAADFRFNGWGGKFDAAQDDSICRALSKEPLFQSIHKPFDLILEGGSIDCDGAGSLLTTRQCLLSETRNPGMTMADYDALFAETFGIKRVLWLANGELQGDDTDGHVDMLARFCDARTIAYTSCERADDAHQPSLQALETELRQLRDADGHAYDLIPLPIPQAIYNRAGRRLPASYANFLIINGAVLVPVYDDANDQLVLERLRRCFPAREVIGINATTIIEQYGSLHCLTMQLARGSLALSQSL